VRDRDRQDVAKRLMNADLHGACLHVTQSRCSSLVGISGIVLQETKNAFVLVTSCNKLKSKCKNDVCMFPCPCVKHTQNFCVQNVKVCVGDTAFLH